MSASMAESQFVVELVKEISPGPSGYRPDAVNAGFTELGGRLFFKANDGIHGNELWVTDGTAEGTELIKDIYPGMSLYSDDYPGDGDPQFFIELNGKLFFNAKDGVHELELWATDGTEAGTQLVKDISPGRDSGGLKQPHSSNPLEFARLHDNRFQCS